MLFVLNPEGEWSEKIVDFLTVPPEHAGIVSEMAGDVAQDVLSEMVINTIVAMGQWLATKGLFLLAEGLFLYALFCFLCAISGTGKWIERGVKASLASVLVGVATYAV